MRALYFLILCVIIHPAAAQFKVAGEDPVHLSFSNILDGVSSGYYSGSGYKNAPATGTGTKYLDSRAFEIEGFSLATLSFDDSFITGPPLAYGSTSFSFTSSGNPVTTSGIRTYVTPSVDPPPPLYFENPALMIQASATECNPGYLTVRMQNTHPSNIITELTITTDLWYKNNQNYSLDWKFSYSLDNITYTDLPDLTFTTPDASDLLGIQHAGIINTTIASLEIMPYDYFYFRYTIAESSGLGTGEFDEFFLDDIIFTAPTILPITLTHFTANTLADNTVLLQWTTASEINSHHFIVERKIGAALFVPIAEISAAGNSSEILHYSLVDDSPVNGTNYYRLLEVDLNGNKQYSQIISAEVQFDKPELILYPNPASNILYIMGIPIDAAMQFLIYDVNGQLFLNDHLKNHQIAIDKLPDGTYILQLIDADNIYSAIFVKD